ncbi:vWA domain-containing protein [Ornithinibacillus sp. 179-J 7C1 HS]|uniref:vWA domain-containing protein n=1 Tax=Ornithinibacillus sp. 179-J 7C1 HS TaxID=3142384 RepID=UPI0039A18D6F
MNFITPIFFLLTVFLLAVILFYLFRKQYDRQVIPSTLLWQQVMQEWQATKWWKKLQNHLLLYLQLFILLLLIVALTRPFLGMNVLSGEHIVIVLDTSASMTVVEEADETTRFTIAKGEMEELIDQLDQQMLTVILAEEVPTILFSNETDPNVMKSKINEVTPSYQHGNVEKAIDLGIQILSGTSGEIHVYSDLVRKEQVNTNYLQNKLVVHSIGTSKENLSLHTFGVSQHTDGINGLLTVYNESEEEQLARITIECDGQVLTSFQELIGPGKLVQLPISDLPVKPYYKAVLNYEDNYVVDNTLFAFLGENTSPTIHVVGEINSFTARALNYFTTDLIQSDNLSNETDENVIYILEDAPDNEWPNGPALIFSPTDGESIHIKDKENLQDPVQIIEDTLFQYVDMEQVYIQSSKPYVMRELETILASGEMPLISKGYYKGNPIILVGFNISDTDWPLHSSFPIFLYNAINFLTEKQQFLGYVKPSEKLPVSHDSQATNGVIVNETDQEVMNVNLDESFIQAPRIPGLYKLIEETEGSKSERLFTVAIDTEEKYIHTGTSFIVEANEENAINSEEKPNEIWHWLVLVAFVVLLIEWEVYRRGITI